MPDEIIEVDPRTLHLPPSRPQGADPWKLSRQIAQHGTNTDGMPPLELVRGKGGALRINDGVTRATGVATLLPGQLVRGVIIEDRPELDINRQPTIGDLYP